MLGEDPRINTAEAVLHACHEMFVPKRACAGAQIVAYSPSNLASTHKFGCLLSKKVREVLQ